MKDNVMRVLILLIVVTSLVAFLSSRMKLPEVARETQSQTESDLPSASRATDQAAAQTTPPESITASVRNAPPRLARTDDPYDLLRAQQFARIEILQLESEKTGRNAVAAKAKLRKLETGSEIYLPQLRPPFMSGQVGYLPAFPATVLNVIGDSELLVGWSNGSSTVPFWLVGYSNEGITNGQSIKVGGHLVTIKQPVDYPTLFGSNRAIQLQFFDEETAKQLQADLKSEFQQLIASNRELAEEKRANRDLPHLAESRLQLARQLQAKGNIRGAREFLESLLEKYPETPSAPIAKSLLESDEYVLPYSE